MRLGGPAIALWGGLLVAGCGGGPPRACALGVGDGCPLGCGAPLEGRRYVPEAECLAGEAALFCVTAGPTNEAMGCLVSPEGILFVTTSRPEVVAEGWRRCETPDESAAVGAPLCMR